MDGDGEQRIPLYYNTNNNTIIRRPQSSGSDGIRNRTRQSRSLSQEDLISVTFNIKITLEGAISLGLVQLPGICLGLFGVFRAFQRSGLSKQSVKDSLRSCLLFFLPFFIVELIEFVHFILSAGINLCCALVCSKVGEGMVSKFDLLFFLGNKDSTGKEKILALDSAKVFFGSVLQFCVQFYFIEISKEIRWSQCFSVVSSLLLITKTGYEIMSYTRDTREHQEELSFRQKAWQLLRTFGDFLTWLPLLGSNLVFKLGTINLCILFFGWYSILAIFLIFLINILSSFLATNTTIKSKLRNYQLNPSTDLPDDDSAAKSPSFLTLLYTSYTNIFIISRTVATKSKTNLTLAILQQPLHFIVGIIFIAVFKNWWYPYYYFLSFIETGENFVTSILFCGLLSFFFCFINWECKVGKRVIAEKSLHVTVL